MMGLFRNKKGDTSIVLLVFMVFLLCGSGLFLFVISNGSYEKKIANIGLINDIYSDQRILEYSMQNVALNILSKNPQIAEQDFISSFKEKYANGEMSAYFDQKELIQIASNSYNVKLEDKKLKFTLKNFIFSRQYEVFEGQEITTSSYKTDISFELAAQ